MSLDPKAMSQTRLPVKGRKDLTSRAENATMPKFAYAWLSLMPSNFDEEIKSADNHVLTCCDIRPTRGVRSDVSMMDIERHHTPHQFRVKDGFSAISADPSYNLVAFPFSHSPHHMLEFTGNFVDGLIAQSRQSRP